MEQNPDVAMDAIVHITQQITSASRYELSRVLRALNDQCDGDDNENPTTTASDNVNDSEATAQSPTSPRPPRTLSLPSTLSNLEMLPDS